MAYEFWASEREGQVSRFTYKTKPGDGIRTTDGQNIHMRASELFGQICFSFQLEKLIPVSA